MRAVWMVRDSSQPDNDPKVLPHTIIPLRRNCRYWHQWRRWMRMSRPTDRRREEEEEGKGGTRGGTAHTHARNGRSRLALIHVYLPCLARISFLFVVVVCRTVCLCSGFLVCMARAVWVRWLVCRRWFGGVLDKEGSTISRWCHVSIRW